MKVSKIIAIFGVCLLLYSAFKQEGMTSERWQAKAWQQLTVIEREQVIGSRSSGEVKVETRKIVAVRYPLKQRTVVVYFQRQSGQFLHKKMIK